ncbi:hypothetical protein V6Z12_D05G189300 [Gossypium hirsutum]
MNRIISMEPKASHGNYNDSFLLVICCRKRINKSELVAQRLIKRWDFNGKRRPYLLQNIARPHQMISVFQFVLTQRAICVHTQHSPRQIIEMRHQIINKPPNVNFDFIRNT